MRRGHLLLSFLPAPGTPAELDQFVKQQACGLAQEDQERRHSA